MSLNFYGKQIQKSLNLYVKQAELMVELSEKGNSLEMLKVIDAYFFNQQELLVDVHLGKRSGGWKFTFDHNDWKYFKTKEELFDWLETLEIYDDYNRIYTKEEFLKEVEESSDNFYTAQYKRENPSDCIELDGLTFGRTANFS